MKSKRVFFVVVVMAFCAGVLNINAAMSASLPANEPWTIEVIDESAQNYYPGQYVSIAHHPKTGQAYISYYEDGYLSIAYEVEPGTGNCFENHDWECMAVAYSGDVGKYSSIDVAWVPRIPAFESYTKIGIAFYDADQKSLKYAEQRKPSLDEDWVIQEIDDSSLSTNIRGTFSSLKFTSEAKPIIAYHYFSSLPTPGFGGVKIAQLTSSTVGTGCYGDDGANWDCWTIDSKSGYSDYGTHVSLDVDYDDVVEIAFYDSYNSELVWAYYAGITSSPCANNVWNCETVDGAGAVGKFVSIHAPDNSADKLRFAYLDETISWKKIKYAVMVGSDGNCTSDAFDCFDVDEIGEPIGNVGLSLTVDKQGYPVIAYMDAYSDLSATKLKVARPAIAYGNTNGNCGEVPPGDLFLYWQCETIDNGYQDIVNEAAFADVSISPTGLATIAYYEEDTLNYMGRLKVAQQQNNYAVYLPLIIR